MKKKENQSLLTKYLRYALATVSSLLVYSMYSIVDGIFISRGVNEYAMSAVNLVLPYTNVLFSVAVIFSVGTSTVAAIFLGEGNGEKANSLFSQNAAVVFTVGAFMTAAVLLFREQFAVILGANEKTMEYTVEYINGVVPFSVFFMLSYNLEVLIKTDGYPQKAVIAVALGCLCNCVMDYTAIYVLGWGVFGAALATGLSQLIVCLVYFRHFLFGKSTFRFVRFKPDIRSLYRTVSVGLADGITEACGGLVMFIFNRVILAKLGPDGLVSYTVIAYVNTLVYNVLWGFSAAGQPLISFYHGANEESKCRRIFGYTVKTSIAADCVIVCAIIIFAGRIAGIFIANNEPLAVTSAAALRVFCLGYLFSGINLAGCEYLTARENPAEAMIMSVCRGLVIPAVVINVLSLISAGAIWYVTLCAESVSLIIAVLLIKKIYK